MADEPKPLTAAEHELGAAIYIHGPFDVHRRAEAFAVVPHVVRRLRGAGYEIREIAKDEDRMHEPVASELDIEMVEQLRALRRGVPTPEGDRRSAPPPSAHGGAPPVIPPAGVYGNKVLEDGDTKASKVGVFRSESGGTWFSVEGTSSFNRTMVDKNWTFMGWLELRSVP